MNSKSILILGIVLVILINAIAIHSYINNHIYTSKILKRIKPIEIEDNKSNNNNITIKQNHKTINKKTVDKITKNNNNLKFKIYKKYYLIEMKYSQKELDEILKKIVKIEKKQETKKQKTQNEEEMQQDNLFEEDALQYFKITLEEPIEKRYNQIINIASKMDNNKKIIIKIYHYSTTISSYLNYIKEKLVDNGVDIDDIEVIYKKNDKYKNIIKVLLVKKDVI